MENQQGQKDYQLKPENLLEKRTMTENYHQLSGYDRTNACKLEGQ
jgi:hypothetical protein